MPGSPAGRYRRHARTGGWRSTQTGRSLPRARMHVGVPRPTPIGRCDPRAAPTAMALPFLAPASMWSKGARVKMWRRCPRYAFLPPCGVAEEHPVSRSPECPLPPGHPEWSAPAENSHFPAVLPDAAAAWWQTVLLQRTAGLSADPTSQGSDCCRFMNGSFGVQRRGIVTRREGHGHLLVRRAREAGTRPVFRPPPVPMPRC